MICYWEEVPMTRGRYRAAVIGCGKMSRGHGHAFVDAPAVDLVAAADVNEAALAAFAAEFAVAATYTDPAQMLERERPELVSICTWPASHAELTEAAFAAGARLVWCEKPMAVHLADADRMLAAAEAAGGLIVVNHQRRFVESYMQARELIEAGEIGEVTQITGICAGDTLTDGTHLIDMTRFLNADAPIASVFGAIEMSPMGEVNPNGMGTVEFNQTRKRYGHHVETGALGLLRFANGVRAHLEMGRLARGGYQRFFVEGTEGRIELSGDSPFDDGSRVRIRRRAGALEALPPTTLDGAMQRVLGEALRVLETGGTHTLSGTSGRADLEVVTAILESARRRQVVSLPLDVREYPLEAMLAAGEIPLN
jgi:UDP-N-acetylglucosamine 3-dehydrogenase